MLTVQSREAIDRPGNPLPSEGSMTQVIYILAHSRSGSTLLARMLGQVESWVSVGEVRYLWRRGMVENQPCGCGEPFLSCKFWAPVVRDAFGQVTRAEAARMADTIRYADRVWRMGRPQDSRTSEATQLLGTLYTAIRKVSGASVIIDSSKSPSYARLLGRSQEIRVHLVHLVRDCRGVAYSRIRRVARGELQARSENLLVARTALEWIAVNELSHGLAATLPYTLARYEDVVSHASEAILRIASSSHLPAPDLSFVGDSRVSLGADHTVSGNQMRFESGWIPLRLDEEWRYRLTRGQRMLLTTVGQRWLARYGYL
jgi:hypothetical protein